MEHYDDGELGSPLAVRRVTFAFHRNRLRLACAREWDYSGVLPPHARRIRYAGHVQNTIKFLSMAVEKVRCPYEHARICSFLF